MTETCTCPICQGQALQHSWVDNGHHVTCARCGVFLIRYNLADELRRNRRPTWWYRLSAVVRERSDNGERFFEVAGPLADLEASLPTRTFTWQLDRLLQVLADTGERIGAVVNLDADKVAPRIWARDPAEVEDLMRYLRKLERLDPEHGGNLAPMAAKLSAKGLFRLEEIAKDAVLNDRIFVAMWFSDSLVEAYDHGIAKGITAAGYKPVRIDREKPHGDRIDAKIMVEIQRSRALVADVTGLRASVMLEAGFAAGLGKPVIWTVHEDYLDPKKHPEGLPFDTRQLLHIPWKTPQDLAAKLAPVIEHRLGSRKP